MRPFSMARAVTRQLPTKSLFMGSIITRPISTVSRNTLQRPIPTFNQQKVLSRTLFTETRHKCGKCEKVANKIIEKYVYLRKTKNRLTTFKH